MLDEVKDKIKFSLKELSIRYLEIYRFIETCKFVYIFAKDNNIKTAATNCKKTFYVNVEYFNKLTQNEVTFILMHEVYHCILQHLIRLGKRDHYIWNAACDYYINDKLIKDKVGTMPTGGLYDKGYSPYTPDEIYDLLYKRGVRIPQGFDNHDMQGAEEDEMEGEMIHGDQEEDVSIEDLVNKMANKGGTGNSITKGIQDIYLPEEDSKIDWKTLLRGNIKTYDRSEFSYSRISKKSTDIIFPRLIPTPYLCNVNIAIDMSGSISRQEFGLFVKETITLLKTKRVDTMRLMCFDTQILFDKKYTIKRYNIQSTVEEDLKTITEYGGGTDFMSIFRHTKFQRDEYLIFFTDGFPNGSWGNTRKKLIYVVTHKNITAPIGKTIFFDNF